MLPSIWTIIGQTFTLLLLLAFLALIIAIPIWLFRISRNTQRLVEIKEQEIKQQSPNRSGGK
ncbi:MAG: hypothetical protein ACXIUB_02725 [Wenzhouxiangella sp.]